MSFGEFSAMTQQRPIPALRTKIPQQRPIPAPRTKTAERSIPAPSRIKLY